MRTRFARRVDDLVTISTRTVYLGALVERPRPSVFCSCRWSCSASVRSWHSRDADDRHPRLISIVVHDGQLVAVLVTQFVPNLVLAAAGLQRIDELLATQPIVTDMAAPKPGMEHEIRFEQVMYGVGRPILGGLGLSIRAGERIAIVGAIGSGKSTVLRLMAPFVDPNQGRIRVDGHDLRHLTLASVRRQIGVVFQNSLLIDDTIRENIRMGRLDATDSEIEAAALVGLHRLIESCRAVMTPGSAHAASSCLEASGSSLRSLEPSYATRPSFCSTSPRPRSMPSRIVSSGSRSSSSPVAAR